MRPHGDRNDSLPSEAEAAIYNTQAVVQLTGVPAPTFRSWERRYSVPRPARLPGGQRLYSEADVALIRWLHARTGEGMTISRAVRLLEARRAEPASEPAAASRSFPHLLADLLERLLAFDASGAQRVMGEALALYPLEDVCLALFQPALVEVGERWHQGTVSVATEHFATHLIRRKLVALLQVYDSSDQGRPVLLACAAEELHEIGLLLVALFLARRGWPVVYLGASVPSESLQVAAQRLQPPLVILSATTEEAARHLAEAAEMLGALPAPRPRLGYGGRVFEDNSPLRATIPGTYLGPDARTAAGRAIDLLNGVPAL
jgi:MerR family transcriptional regulator, light-induced transcriptional regulator